MKLIYNFIIVIFLLLNFTLLSAEDKIVYIDLAMIYFRIPKINLNTERILSINMIFIFVLQKRMRLQQRKSYVSFT